MSILGKIFTWWNGATIGTSLFSAMNGIRVGQDDAGNSYYQSKDGARRWVMYDGANDASRVTAEWHGWLHHTHEALPEDYLPALKAWQKPHLGNATGTEGAYHPAGALGAGENRAAASGDYEAWAPDGV